MTSVKFSNIIPIDFETMDKSGSGRANSLFSTRANWGEVRMPDEFYKYITSPNFDHRVAITKDGNFAGWDGKNINALSYFVGRVKKVFAGVGKSGAAIAENNIVYIWGVRSLQGEKMVASFPQPDDLIEHIDVNPFRVFFTTRSGKVGVVGKELYYKDELKHLSSLDNVMMTSTSCLIKGNGSKFMRLCGHNRLADNYEFSSFLANSHTIVLTKSGYISCFGSNEYKQCEVPERGRFKAVEAGGGFSCALREDGTILLWGDTSGMDPKWYMSVSKIKDWSIPWKVTPEAFEKFMLDYGHKIYLKNVPRSLKRKKNFKSMRIMQRMINND